MARDIEEFLRRAAERRQQQKGGQPAKPPRQQQPPRQQPPRQQPPQQRQPVRRQRPVEPEIVDAIPVARKQQPKKRAPSLRQQSVSEHVKSHIDTTDIGAHAELLGDRIADVHEQVAATVHQHLDHDLTELDDNPSITDLPSPKIFGAKTDAFAAELRQMLNDPKSVGKAIILAEILKRPTI